MGKKKQRSLFKKAKVLRSFKYGSSQWADNQLRYIIGILQGKHITSTWRGRINLALITKERLQGMGFKWHVARVENWIHRAQRDHKHELEQNPKDSDLSQERERKVLSYEEFMEGVFA